jgi:hypothetical protein
MLITGTPYDGFQLEAHGVIPANSTSMDLLLKKANMATNCNWQKFSVKESGFQCNTPENTNYPIHTIISSQTNSCNGLKSITIRLEDPMTNKPYFNSQGTDPTMIPYFSFRYYSSTSSNPPTYSQSTPMQLETLVFPPTSTQTQVSGFTNMNEDIKMLYTPSSLFNIYNNNYITSSYNKKEGIVVRPPLLFTGVVNNIPLQTWVNITINITNRSLDIYINGKLEQTYIVPGVPSQMDGTPITVAPPPTFTGWTSNLQYYPYNLNPQTVWSIYQQGYTSNSSILSLLSKYSIKLIFVDNSTKNQVVV